MIWIRGRNTTLPINKYSERMIDEYWDQFKAAEFLSGWPDINPVIFEPS